MIRALHENETIEMSNYYIMTDASSRFAATYNDSIILKLKIWWWNLTKRQRRFYLISLLTIVLLFIIIIIIISTRHKHIDSYQISMTTVGAATTTSTSTTISPFMSITSTNSFLATSTMNVGANHFQLSILKESLSRMPSAALRMRTINSTFAKSTDLLEITKHQ